jgi:Tol biopolymer transport system component
MAGSLNLVDPGAKWRNIVVMSHRSASRCTPRRKARSFGWLTVVLTLSCGGDDVAVPVEELGSLIFVESADDGQRVASLTSDGQRAAELETHHMLIVSPRWSPGGTMIAYVGFETDRLRDLWIVDIEDGRPSMPRSALRWDTAEAPPSLHWLPDESGLVWSEMTDVAPALRHLDLASGEDTWHTQIRLFDIDVAVDGRIVGLELDEQSSTIAVYDAAHDLIVETEPNIGEAARWSPDATEVAFVLRSEPGIAILDPDTSVWERLTTADDRYVCWSSDGSRLSFVRGGQLFVRERASGDETLLVDADAGAHAWSRSGDHIAMPGPDRTLWLLTTSDWTVHVVENLRASAPALHWGPE